jgi:putative hydrolase of the HAD superfamily
VASERDFTFRAVFLDALGTLVELEPPWEHLREVVPTEVSDERLVAAVREEMAYYRAHAHEGRDAASLAELRVRCATVLSDGLGTDVSAEELVGAVHMRAYPDSAPALAELRGRGLKLVVVSNWDCSLGTVLERCGLAELLDGHVSSADAGARKPDPAIFAAALALAGCRAEEALHVGDSPEEDLAGAGAAGIEALLLDRSGAADISSLAEIAERL